MSELKLCPFCGRKLENDWSENGDYYIHPESECILSDFFFRGYTEKIDAWNRRVDND